MSGRKRAVQIIIFLLIMCLTFYALFSGRDLAGIGRALLRMSPWYLFLCVLLAVFFVSAEGFMIWYLLRSMGACRQGSQGSSLMRCIQYSFIGFFYSGITPSATGGQPVQLYYMNKDGNSGSASTVVLMTVAVIYKFVLVVIGFGILLFWAVPLSRELGGYFSLYLFGLFLNIVLVAMILGVMLFPGIILKTALFLKRVSVRFKICKSPGDMEKKVIDFTDRYRQAVLWLREHKRKLAVIIVITFLQRCSVFLLTYMVYLGFGLHGSGAVTIVFLQAAVYIAVDMLPLPGAQGITELMYQTVFAHVFTGAYLIPSMMVSRGINFYFLLIVSLAVVLINKFVLEKRSKKAVN